MNAKIRLNYYDENGNLIENPTEGQFGLCHETQQAYCYKDGEWKLVDGDVNFGMTLYDLNKQIISQMPVLENEAKLEARGTINTFITEGEPYEYYMLLCRDMNYYTIFVIEEETDISLSAAADEIWGCADYLGDVKSVTDNGGAIEFWVQPREEDSEPVVMYLFPYDAGVIKCVR